MSLLQGDNLTLMNAMEANTIDLIYADPPFNSNRNYGEFDDRWESDDAYIVFMRDRIVAMHRVLKDTGSIYLHCDPTMSHYLKIVMDKVFGRGNFRNEVVWCYSNSGRSVDRFSEKHDTIFWYGKSKDAFFNKNYKIPYSEEYVRTHFTNKDADGNICRIRVDAGKERTYYPNGMIPNDWWTDIPSLNSVAKERVGYPTQKPLKLLERIIEASSNEGDIILEPFLGAGTACVYASQHNRKFVGMDLNIEAIEITKERLGK